MRKILGLLIFAVMIAASGCGGCGRSPYPGIAAAKGGGKGVAGESDFHGIFSNSVFGSSAINITPTVCAGRTTLQQGTAMVSDSCFTGDTNVVLCTNVSALNPVRCTPHQGALEIAGIGNDEISYARVK
jgi:hypothetical protein